MNDQKPPHPLDLVNDSVAQEFGWPFSLVMADPQLEAKANSALYENACSFTRFPTMQQLKPRQRLLFRRQYPMQASCAR